jgi:hypothetical protein
VAAAAAADEQRAMLGSLEEWEAHGDRGSPESAPLH